MLDPKHISNAAKAGSDQAQSTESTLDGSLAKGVTADGAANASAIIASVNAAISNMQQQMQQTLSSIQADILKHQAEQKNAKPSDFNVAMGDLRPTSGQGFPEEQAGQFFSDLKTSEKF